MKHIKHIKEYDELKDLLKDMQGLNLALSDYEAQMCEFIAQFGADKTPEDFAEDLYDYEKNPEEFEIDPDSDYYNSISDYYYEIKHLARFDLDGPMHTGQHKRWKVDDIANSDTYKLYLKMSKQC